MEYAGVMYIRLLFYGYRALPQCAYYCGGYEVFWGIVVVYALWVQMRYSAYLREGWGRLNNV
jgi:hypothetical protein